MKLAKEIIMIIKDSKTIAVVGASRNPEKPAHTVPRYLQENGYKIIPVNPSATEIFGERTYSSLAEIEEPVDIVNIFRPGKVTPEIVREAVKLKPKLIWLQLGIINNEAKQIAESQGIKFVQNHCLKVEHMKIYL